MRKSVASLVSDAVALAVSEKVPAEVAKQLQFLGDKSGGAFPVGYSPMEAIRGGLFHWVSVPFNGTHIFCQLRCLNAVQAEQCGDISNITLDANALAFEDMLAVRNCQENLCKMAFNRPTYGEIIATVVGEDFALADKRSELERIKQAIIDSAGNCTATEMAAMEAQARSLELALGYLLPDDTMAFITQWAMGNDVSDIKRISKEALLRSAALAKVHGKAPSDYLSGVFTDYNRREIDAHALALLEKHMKDSQIVEEAGQPRGAKYKWRKFGGKRG